MKVTTEKVNKVKVFEPFKLVIEFNDISEAKQLKNEIDITIDDEAEILILIIETLSAELEKQGFH